ncbi:hypothetical protein [Stratiformator vulcanicus]|uniref:Uncharacterized protein n=1 Tax=Stratiformator vulcanicus TaxID=2527980 RepID=A0A517QXZ2_9PLAN|nr:hypothetical protein [Stratiformator vulcanicus]QDT36448.1 hypothetical protein Pan189_08040 [Stratiformator vulcanicus]
MAEFILNEESAKTPIGEVLAGLEDDVLVIQDSDGLSIATIRRPTFMVGIPSEPPSAEELQAVRERSHKDWRTGMTTADMLAHLESKASSQ